MDKFFIYNLVYRLVKKKKDSFWSLLEEEKDVALDASFKVMQYILYNVYNSTEVYILVRFGPSRIYYYW